MMEQKQEKIQAITVCIFFSEYLKYCLSNRRHFDRWLIVTVDSDINTINFCRQFSIEYCITKRVFENGATFSKGKAINDGLSLFEKDGWIVHVDCDTILPSNFRELVGQLSLSQKNLKSLFGFRGRRSLCVPPSYVSTANYKNYKKFHLQFKKETEKLKIRDRSNVNFFDSTFVKLRKKHKINVKAGPISRQWRNFSKDKWNKLIYIFEGGEFQHLGYFQLFHSKYFEKYPEFSSNANHDDVDLRDSYPKKRRIIFNADCVHIGLPSSGKIYAQILETFLFNIRNKSDFVISNDLKKSKKMAKNEGASKNRFYLISDLNSSFQTSNSSFVWKIWDESSVKYRIRTRQLKEKISLSYDFSLNRQIECFWASIETRAPFNKSKYQSLCFDLMVEGSNGNLEVGYGNRNRTEWRLIHTNRLAPKRWHQFRFKFSKIDEINDLNSLFILRSVGRIDLGTISVSDIFYEQKELWRNEDQT
jgi:hypothetical protein